MTKILYTIILSLGICTMLSSQKRTVQYSKIDIERVSKLAAQGDYFQLPERQQSVLAKRNYLIHNANEASSVNAYHLFDEQGAKVGSLITSPAHIHYEIDNNKGGVTSLYPNHNTGKYQLKETTERYWTCEMEELKDKVEFSQRSNIGKYTYGDDLQSFKLAIITTGEFYEQHGNDEILVKADVFATLSGVNRIFERDFSINFTLSGRLKMFPDKDTDPFTPTESGGGSRTIQSGAAFNSEFDASEYDLGITFNAQGAGWPGGGVAVVQAACNEGTTGNVPNKARIWAASIGEVSNGFTALVTHELGHAFGARHTMNSDSDICIDALSDDNAYEIGSGSTIMSYGGKCGEGDDYVEPDEVINNYFHFASLYAMSQYIDALGCQDILPTLNTPPELEINPCDMDAFQVPLSTPFSVRAEGSDAESPNLTYIWEQFDEDGAGMPNAGFLGPQASLSSKGPLFRNYAPNSNPTRDFPRFYNYFLEDPFETLSKVPRDITLRCTMRDNDSEGGIFTSDEITVNVLDIGPLTIEIDSLIDTIVGGETINLTWNDDGITSICDRVDVHLISLTNPDIIIPIAEDVPYSDFGLSYFIAPGFSIDGNFHFKVECHVSDCFSFYNYSRPFFSTTNCPAPEVYYTCGLDDITANIGDESLNFSAQAYSGINSYQADFLLNDDDPASQFIRLSLASECEEVTFPSGNPVNTNFEYVNFQVSETGNYRIRNLGELGGLNVFEESAFDSNDPCASLVGSSLSESENAPGTTTTTYKEWVDVELSACVSYRLGITSFDDDVTFSVSISGDGIISIEEGNELNGDFYYVVEKENGDIEAILTEADFRDIRQGQKNIYTIKVDADIFNPADFIGKKLSDLGIDGVCVDRSTNTADVLLINPLPDEDGDGYHTDEDCDDTDENVNPGQIEILNNAIDENCDGLIEGVDEDEDGFVLGLDCDDKDPAINPDAEEIANNDIDENCDGETLIIDEDEDGFNSDDDCDDSNADINPGVEEIPNNDIDEDCDGVALVIDADMDGFNSDEDCNDNDPNINPGAEEIPNNSVDENCNGFVTIIDDDLDGFNSDEDCDDDNPDINPNATEIPGNAIDEDCDGIVLNFDADMDGFNSEDDCDDNNAAINPNAEEIPNNDIDENCDGELLIIDVDMDGFNSAEDCDDDNPDINPGVEEIPNNDVDENCDGLVIIIDNDMDGFNSTDDCDDENADINPDAEEIPNNDVDEDCDGIANIVDADMDGFNSDEDCDDEDPLINPDAEEIPNNDVDENCNGELAYTDEDMDGYTGLVDCDDTNANIHPGADEIANNGIDEDCDGEDLTSATDDFDDLGIKIFPNPTQDFLTLELQENRGSISIRNTQGIHIYHQDLSSSRHIVNLSRLPGGVYFIEIALLNREERLVRKLVKI